MISLVSKQHIGEKVLSGGKYAPPYIAWEVRSYGRHQEPSAAKAQVDLGSHAGVD